MNSSSWSFKMHLKFIYYCSYLLRCCTDLILSELLCWSAQWTWFHMFVLSVSEYKCRPIVLSVCFILCCNINVVSSGYTEEVSSCIHTINSGWWQRGTRCCPPSCSKRGVLIPQIFYLIVSIWWSCYFSWIWHTLIKLI